MEKFEERETVAYYIIMVDAWYYVFAKTQQNYNIERET